MLDVDDAIAKKELVLEVGGVLETRNLAENDLVFVTNGSITAATTYGDNNTPAPISKELGGAWSLSEKLGKQDERWTSEYSVKTCRPKLVRFSYSNKDKRIAEYIQNLKL